MLNTLHIKNFAIIDNSEIELASGMTALTGETGAGKSILLDALGLVLGARASADSIREGESRAEISASFQIDKLNNVTTWLEGEELDDDKECLIRRTINSNGKSRATINGTPVSVQMLKNLGEKLVGIHGQHAHQTLSHRGEQRRLLDRYAGTKQLERVVASFDAWQTASQRYVQHSEDALARSHRVDLLQFQLQEFDELDIGVNSVESLESEHRWLANASRIASLGNTIVDLLDDSASPSTTQAIKPLSELVSLDEKLREALDLLESASIQMNEASSLVRASLSALDQDGSRLQWLEDKLAALHRLAKKHQCNLSSLNDIENELRKEFDELTEPTTGIDALEKERDACFEVYLSEAGKLSRVRKKFAKKLSATVTDAMQTLNMTGGVFEIKVVSDKQKGQSHGIDHITFLVSPNPGTKPAELGRVASGGELSRISLCLQLATIDSYQVPTLIFDEVDAGIGGAVAENVGRLLRSVGEHAQVLTVTHLPQVAAQAHHHKQVQKSVKDGKTQTRVKSLNKKETRDEIARMLGGAKITAKSRQHAEEMLAAAN